MTEYQNMGKRKPKIFYLSGIIPENQNPGGGIFISRQVKAISGELGRFHLAGLKTGFQTRVPYFIKFRKTTISVHPLEWTIYQASFGFFTLVLRKLFPLFDLKKLARKLQKISRPKEYDLIHAHWAYPTGKVAQLLSEMTGIPYLITLHGSDIHSRLGQNKYIRTQILDVLENAEKAVFVSHNLLQKAISNGYSARNSLVIPNGVDTSVFFRRDVEESRQKTGMQKRMPVVGFVGNLEKIKGADRLPDIFAQIHNKQPQVQFVIIGDGKLRNHIQKEMKARNLPVRFTGYIAAKTLPWYYSLMDVMLMASREEGFGVVAIEAAACGTPVVAPAVGGLKDSVSDSGTLIPPSEFMNKAAPEVLKLLSKPPGKEILIKHSRQFTFKTVTRQYSDLYHDILDKH